MIQKDNWYLFCDLSTWGKYCTILHLYYIPHRDWLFISLYDPPLIEEDLNNTTILMNCYDDLTQFLMIISTVTAEIKYGPFLLIDTKISHWNWTPMTCFILSHIVLPMAFPMIAVVKLISNNHTNSNQPYDCYLSPFISRSNDHTNSIQILWSLLTNIVPTHSNIANFLVAAYTRHMAKFQKVETYQMTEFQ